MGLRQKRRSKKARKSTKSSSVDWRRAPDIKERVDHLIELLSLDWVDKESVNCFRSSYSKSRAVARIWGLNRIWQMALDTPAKYVIEVLEERYDKLPSHEQDKVLLHEIAHIPKTFSGALLPHTRRGKGSFHGKLRMMIYKYKSKKA